MTAGEPVAGRHAGAAHQQQCRHPPMTPRSSGKVHGLPARRPGSARKSRYRKRSDAEQPDFVLCQQERGHRQGLQARAINSAVTSPPIRSVTMPQPWRLMKPTPSRSDSIAAPRSPNAEIAAVRDQMALRHRHGHAAQERRQRHHREREIGSQPNTFRGVGGAAGAGMRRDLRRRRRKITAVGKITAISSTA